MHTSPEVKVVGERDGSARWGEGGLGPGWKWRLVDSVTFSPMRMTGKELKRLWEADHGRSYNAIKK